MDQLQQDSSEPPMHHSDLITPAPVIQPQPDLHRNNSFAILADTDDDDSSTDSDDLVDRHTPQQDDIVADQGADGEQGAHNAEDDEQEAESDETSYGEETAQGVATPSEMAHQEIDLAPMITNEPSTSTEIQDQIDDQNSYEDKDHNSISEEREYERERRSQHFITHTGSEYGRGKRTPKPKNWSFLQAPIKNLSQSQSQEYLTHAWHEYKTSGSTHLIE
jgi:hypothetical protein